MSQQGQLSTISTSAAFPVTPFVVGPAGQAGYQTIQSALDAANAAGGGQVWVQSGTYTENLTFYDGIQLSGPSEQSVFIIGTHTPPSTGSLNIDRLTLQSATDIFVSNAAGSTTIIIEDCTVISNSGYFFNLPNWTGGIGLFDIGSAGTNDGCVNNTGGAAVFFFNATIGGGNANPMILSGSITLDGVNIQCPVNFITGSNSAVFGGTIFNNAINFSNNSTGSLINCDISAGSSPAITMNSSSNWQLTNCSINSSNNPAISGSGIGILTFGNLTFVNNSNIANTLTISFVGATSCAEVRAGADTGGAIGFVSLTNTNSTTISSGIGSVRMSNANPGTNAAWIKFYVGTTAYWVPAWTTNTP